MVTDLRRAAEAEAQRAMHALIEDMVFNPGHLDTLLADVYRAAERVVRAVDELERAAQELAQRDDPEAPDYFAGWAENDLRAAWGDR